ncbi:RNA polymerase sigma factor [Actinoallomurus sp. NPDC050550]|uniref:RNA polymerase sigma factor n=1 Tax=Actinoallomurus sp. NPDC050550 TaxID=3154937 RepID=UPI0034114EED
MTDHLPTDAELWARAVDSEPEAFGTLFDRHARAVYNHCFRRTSDWSMAEDLTSVVFLESWRRRDDVRIARETALPWFLGVANNVLRNARRSVRRHQAALARVPPALPEPDPADDVGDRIDDERAMRRVTELLRRLPTADRDVIELCLWDGLSYEDAATTLDVPVGTVRSRLSRARARLRAMEAREPSASDGHRRGDTSTASRTRKGTS